MPQLQLHGDKREQTNLLTKKVLSVLFFVVEVYFGVQLRLPLYVSNRFKGLRPILSVICYAMFIRILESDFWEKIIFDRASDFPTKCLKILG